MFWQLDKLIKNELYWVNKRKPQMGLPSSSAGAEADPHKRIYGTAVPASIPESTAWWKIQQKNLGAICDEAELGLMTSMVGSGNCVVCR